ncbi:MAG TPA: GNAT family N-acetyltransferase [Candidatus Luteimonas excrementigallinarum]|nr:GNAT family N-acetyltransferase [Candidatus Luteimonas excrementigallinarum]
MKPGRPTAPCPLTPSHVLGDFSCGHAVLDDWLKRRALVNQVSGASRTFVTAEASGRVLGYYSLAGGAVTHGIATGQARRNMPDPIPVVVLGRLAVDRSAQGRRLGAALLRDAVLRSMTVAEHLGVRAMLAHALDEQARDFYLHHGFRASPIEPLTVMLVLPRERERLGGIAKGANPTGYRDRKDRY